MSLFRSQRRRRTMSILAASAAVMPVALLFGCSKAPSEDKALAFVSTLAGLNNEFGEAFSVACAEGAIYVADGDKGQIAAVRGDDVSVFAEGLNTPSGIAMSSDGSLIVADSGSNTINHVGSDGVRAVAGQEGHAGYQDGDADSALFRGPIGVAVDGRGRIYVADTYNDKIRMIDAGVVSTIAGGDRGFADGRGADARFNTPTGIAVWNDRLLIADTGNRRIRVLEADGEVWTLAGTGETDIKDGLPMNASFAEPTAIAAGPERGIFVADGNAIRVIGGIVPTVRSINRGDRGFVDGVARSARFSRPSGLCVDGKRLIVADAENRVVRSIDSERGREATQKAIAGLRQSPEEFRMSQPPRWPFEPAQAPRDIAGTLGELRGDIKAGDDDYHFHNGLDIAGAYGEIARAVRSEKVLRPLSTQNFNTLRELIRLPTMGYIHIRLGRDKGDRVFDDPRFLFDEENGKLKRLRVPRGSVFKAGDAIGTLNAMNHVHLISGRSGAEMNALAALRLPGISDTRPPVIELVEITNDQGGTLGDRPKVSGKIRVIMRAYDQVDRNSDRRRLGIYEAGYQIFREDGTAAGGELSNIIFDELPDESDVPMVYAPGSHSGATGETIFRYIVTNFVQGGAAEERFIDTSALPAGKYSVRVFAADFFGNRAYAALPFEVTK